MWLFIVLLLAALTSAINVDHRVKRDRRIDFSDYTGRFNKHFRDVDEHNMRFKIFKKKSEEIDDFNLF